MTREQLIADLQRRIREAMDGLVTDEPFAIVDFPDIRNCGDSAIWLGEIAYLRRVHGRDPAYVSRMADLSRRALRRAVPDGPIFIHGGGNFGDTWVGHQQFRETVLERFRDRRVVQFSQSIHYADPKNLERTRRIIASHPDFVLLVRDEESRDVAEAAFDCDVRLCPDMAFYIGPIARRSPVEHPVLAMLRDDRERQGERRLPAGFDVPVEDWISESKASVRRSKRLGAISALRDGELHERRLRTFTAAANNRLDRGIRQISRGQAIVTDRLHVHICSLLLGTPHAVLDNSYGKIDRYMRAFSGGTELSHRATSLAEGLEWATERAASA